MTDDTSKKEESPEADLEKEEKEEVEDQERNIEEERLTGLFKGDSPDFKWYVSHVLTGYEGTVKKALVKRIYDLHLEEYFSEIYIPEESVTSNIKGRKRTIKKKFFPGYVLVKMILNDSSWHLVKNTDKVTGFVGANRNKPVPLSDEEAAYMTNQGLESFKKTKASLSFSEGDNVRVIEGPFASFVGTIEAVNEKGKVRVQVSIFGRPTPVELDFTQIEKA